MPEHTEPDQEICMATHPTPARRSCVATVCDRRTTPSGYADRRGAKFLPRPLGRAL